MEDNIIAIIIAIVAVVPGVWALIATRKKSNAEATDIITDTAMSLIAPLKGEIAELRQQLDDLRIENELLRRWAKALVVQVVNLGGKPCPEPELPINHRYRTQPINKEKT
jgi:hypothetical protein